MNLLTSIPSPGSAALHIGPLQLRAYGLMIAIGVIVAVRLWGKRLALIGVGGPDDASGIAVWAVPAGVIGARLYHVATEWDRFSDRPFDIVKIWKGGLGIPGGMFLGIVMAVWLMRRRDLPVGPAMWAVAPALPLAQAIGRWGNWWNQELFGRPTGLPWGLEVDPEKVAAAGYAPGTLFHPTFLYESLWNLALTVVLIVVGRRIMNVRPGRLLAGYVIGYGVGRFWVEGLRIDPAKEGAGLRLNQWMAIVLVVGGLVYLLVEARRARVNYRPQDVEQH
ncbi:MAG: prolipoprotein diacylglyceryl transferase [Actinomycetota bacterium]